MTHTNAGADQLFVKLFQCYKRVDPFISEEALERLYNSIDDKKWLETVLSQYSEEAAAPRKVERPNTASFQYSTSANLYAVTVIVPVTVQLSTGLGLVFNGKGKGLFGSIVGQTWGTLWYNNLSDLTNESDFEVNFVTAYANLNLIRNGQTYATYSGGGTPMAGIGGGTGQWS
ncbi:MAG: VapA/VapB family virulence-associated protein [Methylocella sp.]